MKMDDRERERGNEWPEMRELRVWSWRKLGAKIELSVCIIAIRPSGFLRPTSQSLAGPLHVCLVGDAKIANTP